MTPIIINRLCDGQPGRECPAGCTGDCDFNNAALDRVMNYPLSRVQAEELPQPAEPEENQPWSWIDELRFCVACVLTGAAIGFGLGLGRFFNFF